MKTARRSSREPTMKCARLDGQWDMEARPWKACPLLLLFCIQGFLVVPCFEKFFLLL